MCCLQQSTNIELKDIKKKNLRSLLYVLVQLESSSCITWFRTNIFFLFNVSIKPLNTTKISLLIYFSFFSLTPCDFLISFFPIFFLIFFFFLSSLIYPFTFATTHFLFFSHSLRPFFGNYLHLHQ